MDRAGTVREFYTQIDKLERRIGGRWRLLHADARRPWPERGVFFLVERHERRTGSGVGSRIVHVGTHALSEGSGSTLWSCLRQHRGNVNPPGGNHRASRLRKMVGEAMMAHKRELAVDSWGRGASGPLRTMQAEAMVERLVSRRIGAMSVVCLPVEDAPGPDRLRASIARNAIALLSGFVETSPDPPSSYRLGRHCPRERVRGSGWWNDDHMDAAPDATFLEVLGDLVLNTRSSTPRPSTLWPNWPRPSQSRNAHRRTRHGTVR